MRSTSVRARSSAAPPSPLRTTAYTLAQKIVGRACGAEGVSPRRPTANRRSRLVGSQDTTGTMNRNELEELACLGFSADLVLQTFCHTVGLPQACRHRDPAHAP